MYETVIVVVFRFLSVPLAQYSPAPWVASNLIATLGFCANSGIAHAIRNSTAIIGRTNVFIFLLLFLMVEATRGPHPGSMSGHLSRHEGRRKKNWCRVRTPPACFHKK